MLTKFLRKLSGFISINNNSKFITNSCRRCLPKTQALHDWKRQMGLNEAKRKAIPRLVYLHNPWKYFMAKLNLIKFRTFWDPEFDESEFIRGSKQAAVVLTNMIRNQNAIQIRQFATPVGYKQITRDMQLSRGDSRLKLVRFEPEHLLRAITIKVVTKQSYGRRYCFIDMLFVGMRNTKDFDSAEEAVEIRRILQQLDTDLKTPYEVLAAPHRIVFAEIYIRFRRDYTEYSQDLALRGISDNAERDWSVAFYKILTFDILNYDDKDRN